MPRVSVVIPNLNGEAHLADCLGSLGAQTFQDFEVLVVDNGSTDGSETLVRTSHPTVHWIALGSNRGFSAAVNEGLRRGTGELLVLLNNDTRADARWLERIIAALDEVPSASFAASKLLQFESPHAIDAAGDGYSLVRASGFPIGRGAPRNAYHDRAWVFGACAAAAAYRRSTLDDIGLFDEEFFLLYEDVDIDLRAQVAGHRCLYVPDAIVLHKRGASFDAWTVATQARAIRNRIWAAGKNLPAPLAVAWSMALLPRLMWVLLHVAATGRHPAPKGIRPPAQRRMEALSTYRRELSLAVRRLPSKRRDVRASRRLGSTRLAPALTPRHRPV